MSKENVKADKEALEQPVEQVQGVQEESGNSPVAPGAPEETEGGEKKHPLSSGQSNSEQKDSEWDSSLDSENKEEATGREGDRTDNQVSGGIPPEETEVIEKRNRNRIAKDVFEKNSQCEVLYFTADLIPFFVKNDAVRHAGTLKNGTVVTVNRE
jgi:hypothetical protein